MSPKGVNEIKGGKKVRKLVIRADELLGGDSKLVTIEEEAGIECVSSLHSTAITTIFPRRGEFDVVYTRGVYRVDMEENHITGEWQVWLLDEAGAARNPDGYRLHGDKSPQVRIVWHKNK